MMDPDKLARLRELANRSYRDEISDPSLKSFLAPKRPQSGAKLDSDDNVSLRAFSGLASFFGSEHKRTLEDVDIALVGVPFDLGVTNRAGARHGPRPTRISPNTNPVRTPSLRSQNGRTGRGRRMSKAAFPETRRGRN